MKWWSRLSHRLDGEPIEDLAVEIYKQWGIGKKGADNGILLLIAKNDREMRIEVGYGLEGALTDIESNRIISDIIAPSFARDDYFGGIRDGVTYIMSEVRGEPAGGRVTPLGLAGALKLYFPIIMFFLVWTMSILGATRSWWLGGVFGGIAGLIIGFIYGFVFTGLLAIAGLTIFGLLFDFLISRAYEHLRGHGGGPWGHGGGGFFGGGFGGGCGGFGGFVGGSSGGGGGAGGGSVLSLLS